MLTDAWSRLRYHEKQSLLWRTAERFPCVAAGRGSGKTELERRRIVRWLPVKKDQPAMYFYGLPTYGQAKRVAWDPIRRLIPDSWIKKELASELYIKTHFNSELWIVGLDKPQRIEGNQWDGGVIDEACDTQPGTFAKSVVPALTHKRGWCHRIGVPKRFGIGANEFRTACEQAKLYLNWPSTDILSEAELEEPRRMLDERDFREQFMASWESAQGLIFYAFDRLANVRDVFYDPSRKILVGSDFNVDPMCWVLGQKHGEELWIFDEVVLRNTNTQATLDNLHRRYPNHQAGWEFYGDASGRARKTAAALSDYVQIRNDQRFGRKGVFYPSHNPKTADRFAACNAMLCNAVGQRRLFIDRKCKRLIADMEGRAYVEGSREPNDSGDMGHASDGLGYLVYIAFPIRVQLTQGPQVFSQ